MQKFSHIPYNLIIIQYRNDRFIDFNSDILINSLLPLCSVRGQKWMILNHWSTFSSGLSICFIEEVLDHFIIYLSDQVPITQNVFLLFKLSSLTWQHILCWHDKNDFSPFTWFLAYKVYRLWSLNLYDLKERGLMKWDFKILFSSGILSSANHNKRLVSLPHKNSTKEKKNNFPQITSVLLPKNPVFLITMHFCLYHSNFLSC